MYNYQYLLLLVSSSSLSYLFFSLLSSIPSSSFLSLLSSSFFFFSFFFSSLFFSSLRLLVVLFFSPSSYLLPFLPSSTTPTYTKGIVAKAILLVTDSQQNREGNVECQRKPETRSTCMLSGDALEEGQLDLQIDSVSEPNFGSEAQP